ncbi:MAG: hypothetical protein GQ544_04390, partial [Candidatus Aminicenantes bacterium]|nr:hypothetical protein [Candidatus Aminicenantes bacterium]
MRRFFLLGIVFLLFLFSACGKKGDPLPPLVLVPKPVEQLDLVQQGLVLILEWRLPTVNTDGSPISGFSALEFWMLNEEKDPDSELPYLSEDRFREQGEIIHEILPENFPDYQSDPEASPQNFRYEHALTLEDLGKK